jgi:Outer membrane efflux protein
MFGKNFAHKQNSPPNSSFDRGWISGPDGREDEMQAKLPPADSLRGSEGGEHAVDLANQLYSHGVGDFLSVLEAQESLYSSEDQLVRSQRDAATNLISLYKALGGGWE